MFIAATDSMASYVSGQHCDTITSMTDRCRGIHDCGCVIVRPSLVAQAIMFCCCGQPGDRNQWRDVEAVDDDDVVVSDEVSLVGDRHKDGPYLFDHGISMCV